MVMALSIAGSIRIGHEGVIFWMNILNPYRPGITSVIAVVKTRIAEIPTLRSKWNVYLMGLLGTCALEASTLQDQRFFHGVSI
jgi:hypothetical protein